MNESEIIERLRETASNAGPLEVIGVLQELVGDEFAASHLIGYLKQAFPDLPLHVLLRTQRWEAVGGSEGDAWLQALLLPHWPRVVDAARDRDPSRG